MKTIYISGRITGLKKTEYEKLFNDAELMLSENYIVINPIKIQPLIETWQGFMRADIIELMKCDTIYMLSNWRKSKGAKIKRNLAIDLGYKVIYQKLN